MDFKRGRSIGCEFFGGEVNGTRERWIMQRYCLSKWLFRIGLLFLFPILVLNTRLIQAKSLSQIIQISSTILYTDNFDRPDNDFLNNGWVEVEETGDLVRVPVYDEQDYLEDFRTDISTTRITRFVRSGRHLNPFDNTLARCIFEFLINPAGWHLKKCNQCGKFFIADHGNRKRCESDFCRRRAEAEKKSTYRATKKRREQRLS